MSKTKIINIDDLAQASKAIVIDGITHEMRELTVQEFINKAAEAKKVEESQKDLDLDEQMRLTVTMIHDAFPTVPVERLNALKINQLTAIMSLIVTPPEDIAAEVAANQGNA
jgi:DNA gyrase/topoisomerase IV subunit A